MSTTDHPPYITETESQTDERHALKARILDELPQTQCTQCGFDGCEPYAHAIAWHNEPINQCPPGGEAGIAALAQITQQPEQPLNPQHGRIGPVYMAVIDEAACIGCTKCIQACPVDAIVGAAKFMHTVLTDRCTGCELCIPPCPVDCIDMVPDLRGPWTRERAQRARAQYEYRQTRLNREAEVGQQRRLQKLEAKHAGFAAEYPESSAEDAETERKRASIAAALARARARRGV